MTANRLRTVALAATFLAGTSFGALAQVTVAPGPGGNSYPGGPMVGGPGPSRPGVAAPVAPGYGVVVDPDTTGAIGRTGPGPLPEILGNTSADPARPCPPGRSSAFSSAGGPSATRC
jgi:hypothetical protein